MSEASRAQLPSTYARLLARALRLDAEGQKSLLAGTRLSPADLDRLEPMITVAQQATIVSNAIAIANRPTFGLEVGAFLPLAAHGPLGQLLACADTLDEGWAALERFHALRVPMISLRRRFSASTLDICLELDGPEDERGRFLLEAMAVTVKRGVELVIGRRLREATFDFSFPRPPHAPEYERFLHGRVRFDADVTRVRLPRALLEHSNPFRDPTAYRDALARCEALERDMRATDAGHWTPRVEHLLQQNPGRLWRLAEVAAHLHLSPRTLMRHLDAEGTSYRALLDRAMAKQALERLQGEGETVESVAMALGYRDATAFRRAFRRWFGVPPSAYRRVG